MKLKAITVLLMFGLLIGCSNEEVTTVDEEISYEEENIDDATDQQISDDEPLTFEEQANIVKSVEGKAIEMGMVDAFMIGADKIDLGNNEYNYIDVNSVSNVTVKMNSTEDYVESVEFVIIDKDGNITQSETGS